MVKMVIFIGFGLVVYNLGVALYHLVGSKGSSKTLLRALAMRVAISILIFSLIITAHLLGLIEPTGIKLTVQD
tara:strand:+ start:222 stop:440 length:219 start_codon:yes stop_codon:yes gene_type:complete